MQPSSADPFSGDNPLSHSDRKRQIDTSRREVRAILAQYREELPRWHDEAALLLARAGKAVSAEDRLEIRHRLGALQTRLADTRMGVIEDFADKPPQLAGHSHVVDFEKALDSLETKLQAIRSAILAPTNPSS